jgi:hypothetical protein
MQTYNLDNAQSLGPVISGRLWGTNPTGGAGSPQ